MTRAFDRLPFAETIETHPEGVAFVGETGIINDIQLRYPNEPARHKTLDLLGDLFLIGAPVKG